MNQCSITGEDRLRLVMRLDNGMYHGSRSLCSSRGHGLDKDFGHLVVSRWRRNPSPHQSLDASDEYQGSRHVDTPRQIRRQEARDAVGIGLMATAAGPKFILAITQDASKRTNLTLLFAV